jgi:hypothetical protein
VLIGLLLTGVGVLLIDHGDRIGSQVMHLGEIGLAVGAVLGLVPDRLPAWRAGSFAVGFVAAWAGFALRAGFLPDIPLGRALAVGAVFAVMTIATAASFGRLPLWAGLLGVAAFAGGYETTFSADPSGFVTDSTTAATTLALTAGLGFFVVTLVDGLLPRRAETPPPPPPPLLRPDRVTSGLPRQRDADAFDDTLISAVLGEDAR